MVLLVATDDIAEMSVKYLLNESWKSQDGIAVLDQGNLSTIDMANIMTDVLEKRFNFIILRQNS